MHTNPVLTPSEAELSLTSSLVAGQNEHRIGPVGDERGREVGSDKRVNESANPWVSTNNLISTQVNF